MRPTAIFADHLRQPDVVPEMLALDIARLVYPDLDTANYLGQLDALAEMAAGDLLNEDCGRATAVAMVRLIHDTLGFRGNLEEYYDPRNCLLPDVLERRVGLPIMLSLLCMAIGRRLHLRVDGIGFPAHFMASYQDDSGFWLLDPFYGAVVDVDDAQAYLNNLLNRTLRVGKFPWRSVTPQAMAYRILNNLRNAFAMQENPYSAAQGAGLPGHSGSGGSATLAPAWTASLSRATMGRSPDRPPPLLCPEWLLGCAGATAQSRHSGVSAREHVGGRPAARCALPRNRCNPRTHQLITCGNVFESLVRRCVCAAFLENVFSKEEWT